MNRNFDHFQDHLEWEVLEPELEITNLTFETGLYSLNRNCIIKFTRDNQYDLSATISGIAENSNALKPNIERKDGTFVTGETIIGYSKNGFFKYKFSGALLGASQSTGISIDTKSLSFKADLLIDRIEKSYVFDNPPVCLQEWYLTGSINMLFPRSTSRNVDKTFKRLRDGIDPEDESRTITSSGSGSDYLLVKYADTSFIVSKVPEKYGPNWAFNIAIEYRKTFGRIPNEEEREAISELVGFVLGNQLLKVGQTSYDESSSLTIQDYQNPWGDNVVSRCQKKAMPPVSIKQYDDWGKSELLLNELIPHYMELRNPLRLKDTIWKYWTAKYSSLGTNLPILSSALETLADRTLKSHPKIKQYYIEYNEFSELIKNELISIDKTLDEALKVFTIEKRDIIKESIIRKIKGASQRGSNEKLEMMFEIIGLDIDKIERKAIKARNKMAHSSLGDVDDEELKEVMRLTRAYETLFNRTLLRTLSYTGQYVDYYTLGHPNREINEPIPE